MSETFLHDLTRPEGKQEFIKWATTLIHGWDQEFTAAKQLSALDKLSDADGIVDAEVAHNKVFSQLKAFTPHQAYHLLLEQIAHNQANLLGPSAAEAGIKLLAPASQQDAVARLFLEVAEQVLLDKPGGFRFLPPSPPENTGRIIVRARTSEEARLFSLNTVDDWARQQEWVRRYQFSEVPFQADPHSFEFGFRVMY